MIHTALQLKALVRNRSNSDSKKAQTLIRIYTMERFLERLSVSKYRDYFILKGGILVSSMVGVDRRSTMDIFILNIVMIRLQPIFEHHFKRIPCKVILLSFQIFNRSSIWFLITLKDATGIK